MRILPQYIRRNRDRACITIPGGTPHPARCCPTTLRINKGRQGNNQVVTAGRLSRLFHLRTADPEQGLSATITDPVVVRVPSGLLSGDDLTTALTTGGILLPNPHSESRRVMSSPPLVRAVASISPAGASAAQKASQQRQQLLIAALGALAALLTVVATSVSITGMYGTVHRQRSLVRKLHGWSGLYAFRQVVVWETGLWSALAIFTAWRSVTA